MNLIGALGGGLAGACTLTLLHETARRAHPEAPRLDVLGMRTIGQALEELASAPPTEARLHDVALAGDLLANGLYYSLVGAGNPEEALRRGALLGLLAGLGAVSLPAPLGLGSEPTNRSGATQVMTVAMYVAGGLAAASVYQWLAGPSEEMRASEL